MFSEDEVKESLADERRKEKTGKYATLPRNRRTERELQKIFEFGTEAELRNYLRRNGVPDESARFVQIVKLFRERGGKRP